LIGFVEIDRTDWLRVLAKDGGRSRTDQAVSSE
jgi:hypothetical protein